MLVYHHVRVCTLDKFSNKSWSFMKVSQEDNSTKKDTTRVFFLISYHKSFLISINSYLSTVKLFLLLGFNKVMIRL
jgi:hypothetical protein